MTKNSDSIVGVVFLASSAIYTIGAWMLPNASIGNPMAPKYFPLLIGGMGVVFSVLLVIQGVRKKTTGNKKAVRDEKYWLVILELIGCCLIYTFILEKLGFMVSTSLFLGAMLFIVNGRKAWLVNIITAVLYSAGTFFIFNTVFQMTLPSLLF
jgi:putative tricarboxylic transport membrane protein